MDPCAECGFVPGDRSGADLAAEAARFGRRYRAPLTRFLPGEDGDAVLRRRPDPATWSALEYAAHVRDALGFYAGRVRRIMAEDRPRLEAPPGGFDALCAEQRYNEQEPATVADEVAAAADDLAGLLGGLGEADWSREGVGSEGDARTVRVLAERAVHEGHHHLLDVGRSLRSAREAGG